MSLGSVYVASIASSAKDAQTVKAFLEAESYPGPSLIIAYSPCIAHGYDLARSAQQSKLAVDAGYWPLYRYDPRRLEANQNPLQMDSAAPRIDFTEYARNEVRYRMVEQRDPERFRRLMAAAQEAVNRRFNTHQQLAKLPVSPGSGSRREPAAAGKKD